MAVTALDPLLKVFYGIMGVFYVRFALLLFVFIVFVCALYSLYGSLRAYVKFIIYVMIFVISVVIVSFIVLDSNMIKNSFESDNPMAKWSLQNLRVFFVWVRNMETLVYEKSSIQDVVPRWMFEMK